MRQILTKSKKTKTQVELRLQNDLKELKSSRMTTKEFYSTFSDIRSITNSTFSIQVLFQNKNVNLIVNNIP